MSNSNIYNRDDVIIDPRLGMPAEIIGVRAGIPEEMESVIDDESIPDEVSPFDLDISYEDPAGGADEPEEDNYQTFPPPELVSIISQTVRISPDGTHLVDLVLEVSGEYDQFQCEVRATKA
jgi:hypothetical protein